MRSRSVWTGSALTIAAGVFAAGIPVVHAEGYTDWAPVISSTPIVQRINQPREECWTETVTMAETRRVGGVSLGSYDTSTSVVVPVTRDVQRCRTVEAYSDLVQGYDVRYLYQGREYVTRTATLPGDRIRVDVNVSPGLR